MLKSGSSLLLYLTTRQSKLGASFVAVTINKVLGGKDKKKSNQCVITYIYQWPSLKLILNFQSGYQDWP